MKKRLFAVMMMLVMLLAAMVITAQAATVPEDVEWIELGSKEDFLEWFGGTTTLSDGTVVCKNMTENYTAGMTRYYKLTADITIDVDSTVYCLAHSTAQVNTYFDLNGKTLTYSSPASAAKRFFNANNANTTHTFVNGTVVNNSTSNYSGTLFLMSAGNLAMEDVVITDNARDMNFTSHGKAIYSAAGGSVTLTNVDITVGLNRASTGGYGLAVHSVNGNLTMTGCNLVYAGTASVNRGGLIYKSAGITNITNCTFAGGYATYGGNIFIQDGDCNITGCTFTAGNCLTGSQGVNLRIANNSGKKNTAVITGCTFNGGTATASVGGNVYSAYSTSTTYRNCTFIGGKAANGGSIYAVDAATTFEDCKISGGTATGEGGNVLARNNTVYFINTDVSGGTAVTGGNIAISNKAVGYIRGGTISGGNATNGGNISAYISGAITPGPTLYLESGTITGGTATTEGGNIYAAILNANHKGIPSVTISGGVVTDGKAKQGANISVHGVKGVLATMTMTGGTIGGTPAQGKTYAGEATEGGNIYATYATVAISGGEVSNGYSPTIGGNIYPSTAATVTISGTAVVSGGVASRGGNFYMSSTNTVLNIQGGTVKDGLAYTTGGNIDVNNGKLNVTGGIITGGYAEGYGGNIYAALGYGAASVSCGAVTIKDDGNAETPLAQITNGVALREGGNIYAACNGNTAANSEAGATNKVILGNFILSGGKSGAMADDLFLADGTQLEILPEFSQDITCCIGTGSDLSMLPEVIPGAQLANNRGISSGVFTGKLIVKNLDNIFIYAKEGDTGLYFAGAALVADGAKTWYKTNEDAVAAYAGAQYLQAAPGALVLPEGEFVVDIAGQNVAITGVGSVTLFDSANDNFATFGTATVEGVTVANTALTRVQNKDYYMLVNDGVYSLHRVEARLTNVALRPSAAGIYFAAQWSCDETVKPLIGTYGVAVSMNNYPGAAFAEDETALYTVFAADSFESGVSKTGAMIAGILKDTTPERIAMNSAYAQMAVFAEAYITIDGTTYTGIGANCSLKTLMQSINRIWPKLTDSQQAGIRAMYDLDAELFKAWDLYNITADIEGTPAVRPLKVLTLGHSLAVDSGHMLNMIAVAEGYDQPMEIATLYYSGCPLYKHVNYIKDNSAVYELYLSSTTTPDKPPVIINGVTMEYGLEYDDWDIIIMQGGVFEIGHDATYTDGNIQFIQDYVNQHKTNPNAVFAWHMPWACPTDKELRDQYPYSPNTYYTSYEAFNDDRTTMFNAVVDCVGRNIVTDDSFIYLIPSGTAIENALSSYLVEKDLHRDFVHVSDLGRVISSYTWYCVLSGIDHLDEIKLDAIPKAFLKSTSDKTQDRVLTDAEKAIILESVNNALANPLQMTQSVYTTAP